MTCTVALEARAEYRATAKRLSTEASAASLARLRHEVGATPEGKALLKELDARRTPVHVVDDKSYPELPGSKTDGYAIPGNGPIYIRRSEASGAVLRREAKNSADTQRLTIPRTADEGKKLAVALAQQTDANPKQPVEFNDRGVNIVAMKLPTPYLVDAPPTGPLTSAALNKDKPNTSETTINASFFDILTIPKGHVVEDGKKVSGKTSPLGFHVAWTPASGAHTPGAWKFGSGDPPSNAALGFGGLTPLIINKTPYGVGNKYTPGTSPNAPKDGDPGAYASSLTQRNSEQFHQTEDKGPKVGKAVLGIDRDKGLMYVVVQKDGNSPGMQLYEVRDALLALGVDDAVGFDGSDSATLTRDEKVVVAPSTRKDWSIPFGIGLRLS